MTETDPEPRSPRITSRGTATRTRIVDAAADLMYRNGVAATTLDDVRIASDTSKSQLYRHFPDKNALIQAVVDLRAAQVMGREEKRLQRLDSFKGLERWRDAIVQNNELQGGAYGCGLGSMANELSDSNDQARIVLGATFNRWEQLFVEGFERMREEGLLRSDIDSQRLATGLMAALQGGYLLAQAARDTGPMAAALDMALDHIKSLVPAAG